MKRWELGNNGGKGDLGRGVLGVGVCEQIYPHSGTLIASLHHIPLPPFSLISPAAIVRVFLAPLPPHIPPPWPARKTSPRRKKGGDGDIHGAGKHPHLHHTVSRHANPTPSTGQQQRVPAAGSFLPRPCRRPLPSPPVSTLNLRRRHAQSTCPNRPRRHARRLTPSAPRVLSGCPCTSLGPSAEVMQLVSRPRAGDQSTGRRDGRVMQQGLRGGGSTRGVEMPESLALPPETKERTSRGVVPYR